MRLYQSRVFLICGFIATLVLAGAYFITRSYLDARRDEQARYKEAAEKVHALMIVKDPKTFTKDFNPNGQTSVNLEVKSRFLGGDRVILSPLFPHRELITVYMSDGRCRHIINNDGMPVVLKEERWLNVDPFWKVFWVEIAKCGEHTMFFGPYRLGAI